jgi:hypothetical protein
MSLIKVIKGRTIRKVMGGGQNQKKNYSQRKIRGKNLPRHSAKKKSLLGR